MFVRKTALHAILISAAFALPNLASAQQFFRIGTGGTAGTYYPVGGMIAEEADALRAGSAFFAPDTIAADTYKGVGAVKTQAVGAQWVTSDKADAITVCEITKALFSEAAQKQLGAGHVKGKFITREYAVQGAGTSLHPGARRRALAPAA